MRVVTSAKRVATRQGETDPIPANFKRRIKENFVDTLCFLFDGILNSAMGTPESTNRRPSRVTRVSSSRQVTLKDVVSAWSNVHYQLPDWLERVLIRQESRLLVTLAKFHYLRETALSSILSRTSKLLDTDFGRDQATLLEVVDNMDEIVFDDFIKRRSEKLVKVVEEGILHGGIDWLNAGKPTGGYCQQDIFMSCYHQHGRHKWEKLDGSKAKKRELTK